MSNKSKLTLEHHRWRWLVWSEDGPPGTAKRAILQVLFDFYATSKQGEIFPSVEKIASKIDLTKKHVIRHLAELEELGWITRKQRIRNGGQGWKRNEYKLKFPHGFDPKKDEWLINANRKRIDARDEYRMDEGWQPDDEKEARRRAEKGDEKAQEWLDDRE